jgi:hypothetical protein
MIFIRLYSCYVLVSMLVLIRDIFWCSQYLLEMEYDGGKLTSLRIILWDTKCSLGSRHKGLHNMHSLNTVTRVIEPRRTRWAGHIARMKIMQNFGWNT